IDADPQFSSKSNVQANGVDIDIRICRPVVFDWNGDAKKDLLAGDYNGNVYYYENTNTTHDPVLIAGQLLTAGGSIVDVGNHSTPVIVDWNNDGCMDLVVGDAQGYVRVFLQQTTPVLLISETDGDTTVYESGATDDSYEVKLNMAPAGPLTVSLSHDAEIYVDKPSLTFTSTDWDTPQTVTVTAVDDGDKDVSSISTISHTCSGMDINWIDVTSELDVTVVDDDNASPVIVKNTVTGTEDTLLTWDITTSVVDSDSTDLEFTVKSSPAHGTLDSSTANYSYNPNPDWNGTDDFLLEVSDGNTSTQVTYSITILPVNDPPVLTDNLLSAENDVFYSGAAIPLQYKSSDIDAGDTITNVVFLIDDVPVAQDPYDGDNIYTQSVALAAGSY
ncbi:hypothetical protein BVX97_00400, partial [bacterium E08(2017)]